MRIPINIIIFEKRGTDNLYLDPSSKDRTAYEFASGARLRNGQFLLGKCSEARNVGQNAGSHHDPLSRLANCRSVGAHTVLIREVSITN